MLVSMGMRSAAPDQQTVRVQDTIYVLYRSCSCMDGNRAWQCVGGSPIGHTAARSRVRPNRLLFLLASRRHGGYSLDLTNTCIAQGDDNPSSGKSEKAAGDEVAYEVVVGA